MSDFVLPILMLSLIVKLQFNYLGLGIEIWYFAIDYS